MVSDSKNTDKQLVWLNGEIKSPPFSDDARLQAGFLLRQLQQGTLLSMPDSRPMPSIESGCHELRIIDSASGKKWRIVYAIEADAVIILDVFAKKQQQTPKAVLENCKKRLKQYRNVISS